MPEMSEHHPAVEADVGQDEPSILDSAKDATTPIEQAPVPEEFREHVQRFLDTNRRLFTLYSGGADLRFVVGNAFFIDMEKHIVSIDASWFYQRGFTPPQIQWACLHELTHFLETVEDAKGVQKHFTGLFDAARQTGKELLEKVQAKYGTTELERVDQLGRRPTPKPGQDPRRMLSPIEQSAYQLHHTFHNVLADVYVNTRIRYRAPTYQVSRPGGAEAERLYREKLFEQTDYRSQPRHLQFTHALLRQTMVPDEALELHPDVMAALAQPITYRGQEYTPAQILERFIHPRLKRNTSVTSRDAVIKSTLQPIFDKLLAEDIAEWDPKFESQQEPSEAGEGGAESEPGDPKNEPPIEQPPSWNPLDVQPYQQGNIDHFDPDTLQKWAERHRQEMTVKEQRKLPTSTSEVIRAQGAEDERERQWAKEQDLDYRSVERYRQAEERIRPYLDDLARLWRQIVYGSAREVEQDIVGHFEHGIELDVQQAIADWPDVQSGRVDKIRVMKRVEDKDVLVDRPERIRVRLLADLSGSMSLPADKLATLREALVLIASSLREFNTYLNLTRAQTKSKLTADVEITFFNSNFQVVKHFQHDVGGANELRERMTMLDRAKPQFFTADFLPLEAIQARLTPADRRALDEKKLMELVFLSTDGGSDNPDRTRLIVDQLNAAGIITRAFQIGTVDPEERRGFDTVWNNGRESPLGVPIGGNVKQLVPAMTLALKKYLGNIRL